MDIERTRDERFDGLCHWPYEPRYATVGEGLRMHYVDEGPLDGPVVLLADGEPTVRETTEAVVRTFTGSVTAPRSLLLGRYDDDGRFQYTGRTTNLAQAPGSVVGGLLSVPARPPMEGSSPPGGAPGGDVERHTGAARVVVEVGVDATRDASGRRRHPARLHRARPDLSPADVAQLTSPL
jgi:hypothetical protein